MTAKELKKLPFGVYEAKIQGNVVGFLKATENRISVFEAIEEGIEKKMVIIPQNDREFVLLDFNFGIAFTSNAICFANLEIINPPSSDSLIVAG